MPATLIIGYGNPMRGDDAIGCHAARQLEQHFWNDPDVEVIAAQQLIPEMAEDISLRDFVLFLDASFGEQPGTIKRIIVVAGTGSMRLQPPASIHRRCSAPPNSCTVTRHSP